MKTITRAYARYLFGVFLYIAFAPAQAALLGLTTDFPDIATDGLLVDYQVSNGSPSSKTGTLIIEGVWFADGSELLTTSPSFPSFDYDATGSGSVSFDAQDPSGSPIEQLTYSSGTYLLTLCINAQSGSIIDATLCGSSSITNSFEITGGISSLGITDPDTVLLTGSIAAFGFGGSSGSTAVLDWTSIDVTGALAGAYNFEAGGIITMNSGDFGSGSFNGTDMLNAFIANGVHTDTFSTNPPTTLVPLPGAIWLFASGLLGLFGISKRKNNRTLV